jgi:capsid protein
MHGESDMNIRNPLWIAAACTLATLAGCTNGQGPSNINGVQRFENKTAVEMVVTQATDIHALAPGQSLDLPINSRDVTVARRNSVGEMQRVTLRYNPGTCSVALCIDIR